MQFLTLLPIALAALVSAQDTNVTSSVPYSNPATTLLTQTDSNGVITGQPAQPTIITSQPAGVTTQPSVALVPAGFQGTTTLIYGNSSMTVAVNGNQTSLITRTPTPTTQTSAETSGTGAAESGSSASGSGSGSSASASSTGNAAAHMKAGGAALVAAGGFFAIFM